MNKFPILQEIEKTPRQISRRELARTLLAGVAAGSISPLFSGIHPIHRHLLNGSLLDSADARLSAGNNKPLFLSAQQLASLDVLAEAIVPGSHKAQSASFIDLLLSVDTQEAQQNFLVALSALAAASQKHFQSAIVSLNSAQLHDLLTALSSSDSPEYQHFDQLKGWIVGAYYSSEIGMRELGWTPDRVFANFPGCSHPGGHSA